MWSCIGVVVAENDDLKPQFLSLNKINIAILQRGRQGQGSAGEPAQLWEEERLQGGGERGVQS